MKTLDSIIEVLNKAKQELEKAIKPGPTLDYSKINPKPDYNKIEAAAPTIDYSAGRMAPPKTQGAKARADAVRAKLDAESKESGLDTLARRQGIKKTTNQSYESSPNDLAMSEKEPHDDPKHEKKEQDKAKVIKDKAEEILDMHKGCEMMKAHSNGQWYLDKAETVEEFKARGGKVDKVPESDKGRPKTFDAKPTKSVGGVYNTGSAGYKKGGPAVPSGMKKDEDV